MRAVLTLYAIVAYALFLATVVWAIVFLAGAMDTGRAGPLGSAVAVNAALLALFAIQHTVMARGGFKRQLRRVLPESAERATFVLASGLVLALLFGAWRPMPSVIWVVSGPSAAALWIAYAAAWLIAIAATFMVDHLDFLGLRQAYQRPYAPQPFRDRCLYAWVRHPMMLGLLLAFWATPRMTVGHLLFAVASSAYIAVGIRFEERDLRRQLGEPYREYTDRVRALVPIRRQVE